MPHVPSSKGIATAVSGSVTDRVSGSRRSRLAPGVLEAGATTPALEDCVSGDGMEAIET